MGRGDPKFISFLKHCEKAGFERNECAEQYFVNHDGWDVMDSVEMALTKKRIERAKKKRQTIKVKKEEAYLRSLKRTRRALKKWYFEHVHCNK